MSEGAAKKGSGEEPQPKKEERRKFQAIKGTRDLLPPETALWNRVEQTAHEVFATYGFGEIRLPIFEETELFARSVGGETDIVSKEMYSFSPHGQGRLEELREHMSWELDQALMTGNLANFSTFNRALLGVFEAALRDGILEKTHKNVSDLESIKAITKRLDDHFRLGQESQPILKERLDIAGELLTVYDNLDLGDSLSLRPEATASVCRAYIENGMQQLPQPVKLYTMGPMFRRERPQKGRYRQFYQIDAEVLEAVRAEAAKQDSAKELNKDAVVDAEVIEMVMMFFERVGLEGVQLDINSIGDKNCRPKYVELLRAELLEVKDKLGADSQRRIETNPLRVLDSKLESEQRVIEKLPRIADHLCKDCAEHYAAVKRELHLRGVKYQENWRLVRGLDYYMRTTFEITAKGLGSQNAVCGGGRYDGLVELLGGPPTKGIGFAIGEDRLILSLQEARKEVASGEWRAASGKPHVYIAWMGEKAYATAIRGAKNLRAAGLRVELPPVEQKFGKALGQADKLGARYALILGDNEVSSGEWTLKTLATGEQQKLSEPDLLNFLKREKPKADPSLRSG